MKDVIGYSRISIKDQSTYSIDSQDRSITQYCTSHNLRLLEIFHDNGESSYTFDRPDWKELEKFIKKNKSVEFLIIADHDRLSRNLAEALLKIKELQDKFGIKVLAATDRFDLDMTDPSNYLMRAFKYMMAESELMKIRQRTKAGMRQAAMSGYHANKAPYGYLNSRTEDKKPMLIIDLAKAPIVKEIFKLSIKGLAPQQIRTQVNPKGYTQKNKSAIQDILSNPVYAGLIKVPAYKDSPEYLVKGKHKAIVSEGDYWTVQGKGKAISIQKKEDVPLRGVLKCWCGKPVTAGNSKSSTGKYYWYYLCNEHRQNLSAVKLHNQLGEILNHLSFKDDEIDYLRQTVGNMIGSMMQQRGEDISQVNKDLAALKKKISETEEKYLSNSQISPESFNKIIGELKAKKIELEKRQKTLSATSFNYMGQLNSILPKLKNLKDAFEQMNLDLKQQFVKAIFGKNLQYGDKTYRTDFIHPFFKDNALKLNEKGLLKIQQPIIKIGEHSTSIPSQTPIELIEEILLLFKTG